MKRKLLLLITVTALSMNLAFSQTAPSIKERITGKWIYQGTEEFGVVTLDSLQKNDWIEFNADGHFKRLNTGKEETGTFKITESTRQIFLTDGVTGKTVMYKIKYLKPESLTLDFQTPDLVHTLYQFKRSE